MPRRIPQHRLKDLLESATRVFIAHGFRRTQMADVAEAMGVAKGTVYLYVESKEALFAAVLRHADGTPPDVDPGALPLRAPAPGVLARELRRALENQAVPPGLLRARARRRVADVRGELEGIVRELYGVSHRHRTVIELIDRCGSDHPELAEVFYARGRYAQLEHLERYLAARMRSGKLAAMPDAGLAARFIVEAIATWAVHIHWDPAPQAVDPSDAEETVVRFVVDALVAS